MKNHTLYIYVASAKQIKIQFLLKYRLFLQSYLCVDMQAIDHNVNKSKLPQTVILCKLFAIKHEYQKRKLLLWTGILFAYT